MHNVRLTEDGWGDYSVPSHLMKTKSAPKLMDSHDRALPSLKPFASIPVNFHRRANSLVQFTQYL